MGSIQYIERKSGSLINELVPSEGMLRWLYNSPLGKATLHILVKRKMLSMLGGWYMSSRLSKKKIDKFIAQYQVDISDCKITDSKAFRNFNDFFFRKIQAEKRPMANGIVSPADGKALAFQSLADVSSFYVKGSEFTVKSFLKNDALVDKYADGSVLIIRLAPTDYHRFHFPATGRISKSKDIKGRYFSISPIAIKKSVEIFCQNYRAYSTLETKEYGDILMSEIGATMVGSIIQTYKVNSEVEKGEEKGYFAFGGSTLVLFFEKGKIQMAADLLKNTRKGYETSVFVGENIASKLSD
ncbi:phosphatidylserine decarboxylase [Ancylomarina sp. 16SWW S1-10-2]|uniref:phosphatidylserine decarboxylase n=1 Tax=Ancylomarina sp. 16SWW S1-10-2 TaxID=2499681 RepID=UPI0012AD9AE7|nr:phosphatidylserine decarboxylase [Ancylomarina sp. 16SWW S1-10-2]MRT92519.1 phosphatidylserine decarboxylase [Ancylomarina sp. 16SWW S1-10-2]